MTKRIKELNMKTILICLFIILSAFMNMGYGQVFVGDQDDHEVLQKYWYYRWRLKNDFLYMGDQPGESLPFSERNLYMEETIGTGDAAQLLGFYISTLVTEFKLLAETQRASDLPATVTELYYAYKAYERLDVAAEPYYPLVVSRNPTQSPNTNAPIIEKIIIQNHYSPSLNGFFIREDFPREFFGDPFIVDNNYIDHVNNQQLGVVGGPCSEGGRNYAGNEHFEHLNYNLTNQTSQVTRGTRKVADFSIKRYIHDPYGTDCYNENYPNLSTETGASGQYANGKLVNTSYYDPDNHQDNLPSTDQIGTILQAFLLTKVSMPDISLPVTLKDGSVVFVNFVQLARDNSERLINFLKDGSSNNGWKIRKPDGEIVDAHHGGVVGQYSFAISQMGNMIHDKNLSLPYFGVPIGFHNWESITKFAAWNTYQFYPAFPHSKFTWNSHSDILNYAANSNSWLNFGPVFLTLLNKTSHNTLRVLQASSAYAWDPFHAMVIGYLHGVNMNTASISPTSVITADAFGMNSGITDYVEYTKLNLIHAPCEGPMHFADPDQFYGGEVKGWNTSKRWYSPYYYLGNTTSTEGDANSIKGYHSGLDFMILHNLYYLNSNQFLPRYVNYIDRYFDENLGINPTGSNPLVIAGYETLTADNTIAGNMAVDYNASEEITLKPGFHASIGAAFHAEIKPVLCGSSFRSAADSSTTSYGMSYVSKNHKYADVSDKFAHLYTFPDSISMEELKRRAKLMESGMSESEVMNEKLLRQAFLTLDVKPNPSKDFIKPSVSGFESANLTFTLMDGSGKTSLSGAFYSEMSIDISQLDNGLYLLSVTDGELKVSEKIVKN
jgi:hypothetical protein